MPGQSGTMRLVEHLKVLGGAQDATSLFKPGATIGKVQGDWEWIWGGGRSLHAITASAPYDSLAQATSQARALSREYPGRAVAVLNTATTTEQHDGWFSTSFATTHQYSAVVLDGDLSASDAQHLVMTQPDAIRWTLGQPVVGNALEQVVTDDAVTWDRDPASRPVPGSSGSHTDPDGNYVAFDPNDWGPLNIAEESLRLLRDYDRDHDGRLRLDSDEMERRLDIPPGSTIAGSDERSIAHLARTADAWGNNDGYADAGEISKVITGTYDTGVADATIDGQLTGWERYRYETGEFAEKDTGPQ